MCVFSFPCNAPFNAPYHPVETGETYNLLQLWFITWPNILRGFDNTSMRTPRRSRDVTMLPQGWRTVGSTSPNKRCPADLLATDRGSAAVSSLYRFWIYHRYVKLTRPVVPWQWTWRCLKHFFLLGRFKTGMFLGNFRPLTRVWLTPRKLTCHPKMEVRKMISFSKGDFAGSMWVFGGVGVIQLPWEASNWKEMLLVSLSDFPQRKIRAVFRVVTSKRFFWDF